MLLRFKSLKKLGIFSDFTAGEGTDLRPKNLIYGFNGSGKTTLSRLLASLEAGVLRPEIPAEAQFEIEISDGEPIRSGGRLDALKGKLLVFNIDFVESNLRWKEGTANPVFFIGKEQAKLSIRLESVEKAISEAIPKREESIRALARAERNFTVFKRDTARNIGEQISQARTYDAATLSRDFDSGMEFGNALAEKDRLLLRRIVTQDEPPEKLEALDESSLGLKELFQSSITAANSTIGSIVVEGLREHETMIRWAKEGLDYHQTHDLETCLFCGNPISVDRLAALNAVLDDTFDQIIRDVDAAREGVNEALDQLVRTKSDLLRKGEITKEGPSKYSTTLKLLNALISTIEKKLNSLIGILDEKLSSPNLLPNLTGFPTVEEMARRDEQFVSCLSRINEGISKHNSEADAFDQQKSIARLRLKGHFLASARETYRELEEAVSAASANTKRIEESIQSLTAQSVEIKQSMREHGRAAESINGLIKSYLGHGLFTIEPLDEGYQIKRGDSPLKGDLSEGEKTAIALCYFLSTLAAEGRKASDLIVVIDDPISSLDTRALNLAFNLIKGFSAQIGQLIVLTHNINFMNETKKWLKRPANEGKAALLFIDVTQVGEGQTRQSAIVTLPKLIREYESEYHYLFGQVFSFANSEEQFPEYLYLMPNALRKVLDIFLAFKIPGSSGLAEKLNHPTVKGAGLAQERVRAIDRLVQVESHAENLDDLIALSSMNIEETMDAARSLLALIKAMDENHYEQMCSIVK